MTGGARRGERHQNVEALFIRDYFRRWLARFKLGAHLLDLSCLLFELRSENLRLFLLQGDGRFQLSDTGLLLLDFLVFLQELIEQHGVYSVVAHGVNLAVLIANDQVGVHFGDFLGDQTELGRGILVDLVTKAHRFECQNGFAGFVHRFNVGLVPPRGAHRAQLTGGVDHHRYGIGVLCCHPANLRNLAGAADIYA